MFVLPPPPKYPAAAMPQAPPTVPGMPLPSSETCNVLKQYTTGPEYQLVVGEGTYTLRDEWFLSTPPPHPSEAPVVNLNPLATTVNPPTAGVKLSLSIASGRRSAPKLFKSSAYERPNFSTYSIRESEKELDEKVRPSQEQETRSSGTDSQTQTNGHGDKAPAFGADNTLLAPTAVVKDQSKRKKPKQGMVKSNSSFISRVIPHEMMPKRLQDRDPDGLFVFANINRAFQWLDLSPNGIYRADHLTKILFTRAHMICHDVNALTQGPSHIDVVIGSSAADILWYEPFSQKYSRLNKNGMVNPTAVSDIHWIPGSENLFLASHMDGTLVVYDKDREDAEFVPEEVASSAEAEANGTTQDGASLHINKSVNSKNQKTNPVASWKISNQKINAVAFSPDSRHLAVVSEDGTLRIIDYLKETLLDLYTSYYGGLSCVCWSPDGQYILTGGQDDIVSIWSLADRQIVARCIGHHSWVTGVAFDPWRCDSQNYRFGSVGEDCRLLLWDFNVNMLHRPKAKAGRQRSSVSSHAPVTKQRTDSQAANRIRSNSSLTTNSADGEETIVHAVESRTLTAKLPPVMSKLVDDCPLAWLGFQDDCIITSCIMGHIRVWDRPKETVNGSQTTLSASSNREGSEKHGTDVQAAR